MRIVIAAAFGLAVIGVCCFLIGILPELFNPRVEGPVEPGAGLAFGVLFLFGLGIGSGLGVFAFLFALAYLSPSSERHN